MADHLYPKGPASVPADLTLPNKHYKRNVWIASIAVLLFILLYLGLSFWFLHSSYRLFANCFTGSRENGLSFFVAVITGFLGIFMVKGLFFIAKKDNSGDLEITEAEQPELFAFINRVADEANAPRPHRVFLSHRVNASVFYDISVINLIFPTRKNLEIGLGLVNTLNLGEFKSILAHEFGHFTQRSMIIGRWVYISQKIAYQIVAKRDAFDRFISGLSRVDLRIAWIGWLLSVFVWSIRSFADIFFKLVLLTQRALSREMEFNADLVAVSLTGSDALIHSLHKLSASDDAYDEAIAFINRQLKKDKAVSDVFAVQSNVIRQMAVVLNNPSYGASPKIEGNSSSYRVFREELAQTPKMWSTHPSNIDREKNAKRIYIASVADERSSWVLFKNPEALRRKMTLLLYKNITKKTTPLDVQESIELHDKEFSRSFLLPEYRGVYLNRYSFLPYPAISGLYDLKDVNRTDLTAQFAQLYPDSIQQELEHLKKLDEEVVLLEGLNNKVLTANDGKIIYRGRELKHKELPETIAQAREEAQQERNKINRHDRLCRNLHYAAAQSIGHGWDEYLVSVATLVHYCEHSQKSIEVNMAFYQDTLRIVSKIRNMGASDFTHLLRAADDLYFALKSVYENSYGIRFSLPITEKLDNKTFPRLLEEFKLNQASRENINSWIKAVDSWANLAYEALTSVREAALDELLLTEAQIRRMSAGLAPVEEVHSPVTMPKDYPKFNPANKRELIKPDGIITKFDNPQGLLPNAGKFVAAASIILFTVIYAGGIGTSRLIVYNGLPVSVTVHVNKQMLELAQGGSEEVEFSSSDKVNVLTTTEKGDTVETFTETLASSRSHDYVYNVAGAAILYSWTAYYGWTPERQNSNIIGPLRWMEQDADYYFQEPPQSIQLKSGETAIKRVIAALSASPGQLISVIKDPEQQAAFVRVNALFAPNTSAYLVSWLALAAQTNDGLQILNKRLEKDPYEVATYRELEEVVKGPEKQAMCKRLQAAYAQHPDNPDLYYISWRCTENAQAKDSAFIAGHAKWPENPWLANATAYTWCQQEKWEAALACYDSVYKSYAPLREAMVDDYKRIAHLLKKDNRLPDDLDSYSSYLGYLKEAENSTENSSENRFYAYTLLANGQLNEALNYCAGDSSLHAAILRLAAVSEGAGDSLVREALRLPLTEALNSQTVVSTYVLYMKKHIATDSLLKPINVLFAGSGDQFVAFMDAVKTNDLAKANTLLMSMGTQPKAEACLGAALLLRDKCPERWRLYASELLFITEKPYLQQRKSL